MPQLQYHDGAFIVSGAHGADRVKALMDLGMSPHPAGYGYWWTGSPYLAAPLWDWVNPADAATRTALGRYAWNYQTSFAREPIPGTSVNQVRLPQGEQLHPFQIAGIQRCVLQPRTLLADEMGLGKGVQACGAINLLRPKRTLIGCPTFLAENWAKECEKWIVDPQPIALLDGAKRSIPDRGIIILPYSRGHSFVQQIYAGPQLDLVIGDELHFLKEDGARRTQPWLGSGGFMLRASRVIGMTGTPMPNNSSEVYGALRALAPQLLQNVSREAFKEIYCSTFKFKTSVTTKSGREKKVDVEKVVTKSESVLNAELRASGVMVRRLKSEVLTQLPPKNLYFVHMTPTSDIEALVAEEMDLYEQLSTRIMTSQELIALKGHIANVRARLGVLKAPKIAEYMKWLFDQGEDRLVLFMLHLEAIDAVERAFEGSGVVVHPLTGRESPGRRMVRVESFQAAGGGRQLVIGQILASGTGLTMTRSRFAVMGELSWTPGTNDQAADRVHRITQTRQCDIPVLTFPHATEQRVIRTNAEKSISQRNVLDVNLSKMVLEAA
jgi:SWI/SNF-related matrix-associated actin-dependent regulator 1 of chromatin subfamily A